MPQVQDQSLNLLTYDSVCYHYATVAPTYNTTSTESAQKGWPPLTCCVGGDVGFSGDVDPAVVTPGETSCSPDPVSVVSTSVAGAVPPGELLEPSGSTAISS